MAFYEIKIPVKYIEFKRFYVFSNINKNASSGKVYFQNASSKLKQAVPNDFREATAKNVPYDGLKQAVTNSNQSTICISDPGIFIKGKTTSWYSVVNEVDICFYIAQFLRHWFEAASLKPSKTLMFGSSAGSFGALRTATFLNTKTNVISVNGQIKRNFNYEDKTYEHDLLNYYKKCLEHNTVIPNIYLLCNYRDNNTLLNYKFFDLITNYPYEKKGTYRPNIIFDLYDGLNGHLRPRRENLLQKIDIAEVVLKSSQDEQNFQRCQDQLNESMAAYQQAIELNPDQPASYRGLAKLQAQKGDFATASANYRQAIELNPDQPAWVYQYLAKALSQQQQLDAAMAAYRQAIELNPDQPSSYRGLAELQAQKGDFATASANYRQAIKLNPNQPASYRGLAKLQAQKGDFATASANYRQAIELNPDQPAWVYQYLAKALSQQQQLDAAIAVCQQAIELNPAQPSSYRGLAKLQAQKGDFTAASDNYRKAIELNPDQPDWVYQYLDQTFSKQR